MYGLDTYTMFPRLSRIAVGSSNRISLANAASLADYYRLATKFQGSDMQGTMPVAEVTHLVSRCGDKNTRLHNAR